jgi:hypothetical protein
MRESIVYEFRLNSSIAGRIWQIGNLQIIDAVVLIAGRNLTGKKVVAVVNRQLKNISEKGSRFARKIA